MAELNQTKPGAASGASQNQKLILEKFLNMKRNAFTHLNNALLIDSSNRAKNETQTDSAILAYEKSFDLIEKSLLFFAANRTILLQNEEASKFNMQLSEMQKQTEERLNTLKTERVKNSNTSTQSLFPQISKSKSSIDFSDQEFLTIGDDILNDYLIIDDIDYNAKSGAVNNLQERIKNYKKASEIVRIDNGVQLFYIADDGTVSTPSYPTTLSVYSFEEEQKASNNQKVVGFVRVGSWLYPLIPNESPAMKTNFNAYIFPNKEADEKLNGKMNCFVGITFEDQINSEERIFFEDVLCSYDSLIFQDNVSKQNKTPVQRHAQAQAASSYATVISQNKVKEASNTLKLSDLANSELTVTEDEETTSKDRPKPKENTSEYISKNLMSGAQYLSSGVASATEKANAYIKSGGIKIKSQLQPNDQEVVIDPKIKKAAQTVRYGTHVTVRVSSFLLDKLGSLATSAAKTMAPALRTGATGLLAKTGVAGNRESASGYVDDIVNVTGSSIKGFAIVYESLDNAARVLAKNITDQTVQVVEHKYGSDLANVTENGMHSVGNVAISVHNVKNLRIARTIIKATAKETLSSKSGKSGSKSSENIATNCNKFTIKEDN